MRTTITMILMMLTLSVFSQVTDIRDGKVYKTVEINGQTWMAENLNYGEIGLHEKYCYNDLQSNCIKYGALYDWTMAMQNSTTEGAQGVCMTGWHIPTTTEVAALYSFLGGISVAGKMLKDATIWQDVKYGYSDNLSGFTGTPTGTRWSTGVYKYISSTGSWWTSTQEPQYNSAYWFGVGYAMKNAKLGQWYYSQAAGVRCIKD